MNTPVLPIDINAIIKMIPHRYPFLMVDRVLELERDESVVALKNVTINEPHFLGHFPGKPIMPGVLIVEAMAQASAVLAVETMGRDQAEDKLVYFMTVDKTRFRKPVVPGDSLYLHVTKTHHRGNVWKFGGIAKVNDTVVAEANFSAMIVDAKDA